MEQWRQLAPLQKCSFLKHGIQQIFYCFRTISVTYRITFGFVAYTTAPVEVHSDPKLFWGAQFKLMKFAKLDLPILTFQDKIPKKLPFSAAWLLQFAPNNVESLSRVGPWLLGQHYVCCQKTKAGIVWFGKSTCKRKSPVSTVFASNVSKFPVCFDSDFSSIAFSRDALHNHHE